MIIRLRFALLVFLICLVNITAQNSPLVIKNISYAEVTASQAEPVYTFNLLVVVLYTVSPVAGVVILSL